MLVVARAQQHYDLFQRAVARALADAVDRALDLARTGDQPGVGVGYGETEVVVAVHRHLDLAQLGRQLVEAGEVARVLVGGRVADGVGDVDHVGALGDCDRADLGRELDLGPGRIHWRELDVLAIGLGHRNRCLCLSLDVLAVGLQLVGDVDVGGRDKGVDPRPLRVLDRIPRGIDIGLVGAREAADHRAFDRAGDRLDGFEVAGGGDRKARLDHVDAEARQLLGDLDLLLGVERDSRRLLAVTQRGVKNVDAVGVHRLLLL